MEKIVLDGFVGREVKFEELLFLLPGKGARVQVQKLCTRTFSNMADKNQKNYEIVHVSN